MPPQFMPHGVRTLQFFGNANNRPSWPGGAIRPMLWSISDNRLTRVRQHCIIIRLGA